MLTPKSQASGPRQVAPVWRTRRNVRIATAVGFRPVGGPGDPPGGRFEYRPENGWDVVFHTTGWNELSWDVIERGLMRDPNHPAVGRIPFFTIGMVGTTKCIDVPSPGRPRDTPLHWWDFDSSRISEHWYFRAVAPAISAPFGVQLFRIISRLNGYQMTWDGPRSYAPPPAITRANVRLAPDDAHQWVPNGSWFFW
jgi:hypothetical protein